MPRFAILAKAAVIAVLAVSPLISSAQEMSTESKEEVISRMTDVIERHAFVPGVDFSLWGEFLEKRRASIDQADSVRSFSISVNRALREFGFSHIRLITPEATKRRNSGGGLLAQSRFQREERPNESLEWVDDETALLKIRSFGSSYSQKKINDLMREVDEKAQSLLLDLRYNGGGSVGNMNHLLSHLMPDRTAYGTFVTRRVYDRWQIAHPEEEVELSKVAEWSKSKIRTRLRKHEPYSGQIAVLINRGSASAAEIGAEALRETMGVPVVGSRSRGAVLASKFARLPDGWSLQYPVSDYVTIKGRRLEGAPVVPDVTINMRRSEESDPVVDEAVRQLLLAREKTAESDSSSDGDDDGDGRLAA
jgi:hypothetical protein